MDKKGTFIFQSMKNTMHKWHEKGRDDRIIEYLFWIFDYDESQKPYTGDDEVIEAVVEADMVAIDNGNRRMESCSRGGSGKYDDRLDHLLFDATEQFKFKSKVAVQRYLNSLGNDYKEQTVRDHLKKLFGDDESYINRNQTSEWEPTNAEGNL